MLKKISLLLTILFTISPASSHYVLELTEDTFNKALEDNISILIDFYAEWCGHCKRFAPIYESASISLHYSDSITVLARIDAYYYSSIKFLWKVSGYPTVNYYFNNTLIEKYPGRRTVNSILDYIKTKEKELL